MTLPTLADAKAVLRVQTAAEDAVISDMLLDAQAAIETYLGVRITAASETVVDHTEDAVRAWGGVRALQLPRYPFLETGPAPVITDVSGTTVDPSTYSLEGRAGRIRANVGVIFNAGPYRITASIGLSAHPDYATRIERLMRRAILDVVGDLYQNRNPGAVMEAQSGVSVTYGKETIPARTQLYLGPYRVSPF